MEKNIAILPGDGIGPEVVNEAIKVLEAVEETYGHTFFKKHAFIGAAAIDEMGQPFPEATEHLCRHADAILFGAIGDPKYDNDPKASLRPEQGLLKMRKTLGLFCNVRPVASYAPLLHMSPLKEHIIRDVDFVVFRELTGGIYFGQPRGRSEDGQAAFDTCNYAREEIERIATLAFNAAMNRSKRLTLVDKANVLATSRLWRECIGEMAQDFPEVQVDYMFVDNAAMQIIQNPSQFDVVLTENMFGDILTDEASVISGSLGLLPSASLGQRVGLFEPIHGSYPNASGKNIANPIGAILSAAMLLDHAFGLQVESAAINKAVHEVIEEGTLTEDLISQGAFGTTDVGDAVALKIRESRKPKKVDPVESQFSEN